MDNFIAKTVGSSQIAIECPNVITLKKSQLIASCVWGLASMECQLKAKLLLFRLGPGQVLNVTNLAVGPFLD